MIIVQLLFVFLLLHYIQFLKNISRGLKLVGKRENQLSNNEFVSILVPFRNEEKNILQSLKSITSQSFDNNQYEIIFIDDNSDDNSFEILEYAKKPNNVKILKSPISSTERAHKKKALKYAIENCRGEIIVTTDADCVHNENWLKNIVNSFDENTAFVSGPVEFLSNGSIYAELQKLEFSSLILVGAGLIGIEKPIICNAANLGFRKSIFNEVGGYEDNLNLTSGDDEFLMQKISRTTNYTIKFCFEKDAISYTNPNKTLNQFFQQRKRWASKGLHYVDKKIILTLILIFLFYLGIPFQLILGIFYDNVFLGTLVISIIFKLIIEYKVIKNGSKNLFDKPKYFTFLLAEILHIPYIIISGISGLFGNYKWKGRNIKR